MGIVPVAGSRRVEGSPSQSDCQARVGCCRSEHYYIIQDRSGWPDYQVEVDGAGKIIIIEGEDVSCPLVQATPNHGEMQGVADLYQFVGGRGVSASAVIKHHQCITFFRRNF